MKRPMPGILFLVALLLGLAAPQVRAQCQGCSPQSVWEKGWAQEWERATKLSHPSSLRLGGRFSMDSGPKGMLEQVTLKVQAVTSSLARVEVVWLYNRGGLWAAYRGFPRNAMVMPAEAGQDLTLVMDEFLLTVRVLDNVIVVRAESCASDGTRKIISYGTLEKFN